MKDLELYYALYLTSGIGAKRLLALCDYFGGAEKAFAASSLQLMHVPGFGKNLAEEIARSKESSYSTARKQLEKLADHIKVITYYDAEYPDQLKKIYQPPALLFCKGNINLLMAEHNLAVIGTRKMTDYGRRAATEICKEFARHGIVVTSGFAAGVDTCAHEAVFDAGGETIAVLGSGIDVLYPASNKGLAKKLLESGRGLIVSELSPGSPPDAKNFPWRNRIVSGLSSASIIIESEEKGGSMITAALALDEGRDIFALPGDISRPTSAGPNRLIFESRARLFRTADDILEVLGWAEKSDGKLTFKNRPKNLRPHLGVAEKRIVDVLDASGGSLYIDDIADRAEMEVQEVLVKLLDLEFKDVVRQLAGKHFSTLF